MIADELLDPVICAASQAEGAAVVIKVCEVVYQHSRLMIGI